MSYSDIKSNRVPLGLPVRRPIAPCCDRGPELGPRLHLRLRPDGSAYCPCCGRTYDLKVHRSGRYGHYELRGDVGPRAHQEGGRA